MRKPQYNRSPRRAGAQRRRSRGRAGKLVYNRAAKAAHRGPPSVCCRHQPRTRRFTMNKFIRALGIATIVALSAPLAAQNKLNISIATGGTGGVYYPLGGG